MKTVLQFLLFALFIFSCFMRPVSAQWVQTNGPYGGDVRCFAVSPDGSGKIFAGTIDNGVFRSTNSGASWKEVNAGVLRRSISALAVMGSHVFASVGSESGLFRSTDDGTQWTYVDTVMRNNAVTSFAVNGANIFAGTRTGGVFRSTDYGSSWTSANTGLTDDMINTLFVTGTDMFAGTAHGGIFVSTDTGATWTAANSGVTDTDIYSFAASGENIFAGAYAGSIFISKNNCSSWTPVKTRVNCSQLMALAAASDGSGKLFAATPEGVFLTQDEGASWSTLRKGTTDTLWNALAVSGSVILAGATNGAVSSSTNGGVDWNISNTGIRAVFCKALLESPAGSGSVFTGTDRGIYLTTDNGLSWSSPFNRTFSVSAFAVLGSKIFVGCLEAQRSPGCVFRSMDNCKSLSDQAGSSVLTLTTVDTSVFAGTVEGVLRSNDSGRSWISANKGFGERVYAIAASGPNIFAGTEWRGVFLSTDNGTNWRGVNSGMEKAYVLSLAVSGKYLFAGTYDSGVYRSTDNGGIWRTLNSGMTNLTVRVLEVRGACLFAGTDNGVFLSMDDGMHWTEVNAGLPSIRISGFIASGSDLYVCAGYDGVWKRPLSEMITSVERLSSAVPAHFNLSQNYPNPFNPSTTIEFSVPQAGLVSLKVFNVLGEVVGTLVHEELQAGSYVTTWDASVFSSGVYFYRLEAGRFAETKKMAVVKRRLTH
jgi:photosystem II stability/assembly factor-like uncharacterized protein